MPMQPLAERFRNCLSGSVSHLQFPPRQRSLVCCVQPGGILTHFSGSFGVAKLLLRSVKIGLILCGFQAIRAKASTPIIDAVIRISRAVLVFWILRLRLIDMASIELSGSLVHLACELLAD